MLINQDEGIRGDVADEEVQDAATGLLELGIEVFFLYYLLFFLRLFFFIIYLTLRKKLNEGGRKRNFMKLASGPRMKGSRY